MSEFQSDEDQNDDPEEENASGAENEVKTWVVYFTEDNYPYYYNTVTGETRWEQPEDFVADEDELVSEDDAEPEPEEECDQFINELIINNVFSARFVEFNVDGDGVAPVAKSKLEFLQAALQGKGSDEQWRTALTMRNYLLVTYLVSYFLDSRVDRAHQDDAAHCLAFAGQIYGSLWSDFLSDVDKHKSAVATDVDVEALISRPLSDAFTVAFVSVSNIAAHGGHATSIAARRSSNTNVPYLGFDARDVATYNLSSDYHDVGDDHRADSEALEAHKEAVMVYLLLVFQMFSNEIQPLIAAVRVQRTTALLLEETGTGSGSGSGGDSSKGELLSSEQIEVMLRSSVNEIRAQERLRTNVAHVATTLASALIHPSLHLDEEAFLQALKAVTAINLQLPAIDLLGATELTNEWVRSLFSEEHAHQQLTEGVLHLVNDLAYPGHRVPETIPILKFCSDLIESVNADGFFYTNDIRLLVDVAIRELTNFPLNEPLDEPIQVWYIKLLSSIVSRSNWATTAECYHKSQMQELLQKLRANAGTQVRTKSQELIGDINLV